MQIQTYEIDNEVYIKAYHTEGNVTSMSIRKLKDIYEPNKDADKKSI